MSSRTGEFDPVAAQFDPLVLEALSEVLQAKEASSPSGSTNASAE
ncbi:MAG TPA: hypothetical protein VHX66_02925 [Solirubrobacteraceae bacterium]|nr:hypothetical protein [Solirubrobacteraceae bacterium]